MKNKIYLENSILTNNNLNQYDIATYVALRILPSNNMKCYVNTDIICYALSETYVYGSKIKSNIKNSLDNLIEHGILKLYKKLNKDTYVLDISPIYLPSNAGELGRYFTIVYEEEIYSIFNIKVKDNFSLLRYFLVLISSIDVNILNNNECKYVGYKSQKWLSEKAQITEKTIRSYNNILEENNLIYINHHNKQFSNGNKIFSASNEYGRLSDKEYIIERGISYENNLSNKGCTMSKQKDKSSSKVESENDYTTTSTPNVEKKEDNKTKPTSKVSRHSSKDIEYDVSDPFYDDEEITTTSMWDDIFM